jgi:superfamily II DNA helicase RecQ
MLWSSERLAGIFVNECQVLDLDSDWREFDGMNTVFQSCTRLGITSAVVFMTATLKRPEKVLQFCGFKFPFDESLLVSPMRDNLTITLKCHPEGTTEQTSTAAIFKSACEFTDSFAPDQRVLVFVLYKSELDNIASMFRAKYPSRTIVQYSRENRSDLSVLPVNALVISTSVLQTGANPPPVKMVLHWGHVFSVEALLQGAGRAGRSGERGHAVLLSTPSMRWRNRRSSSKNRY